MKEGNTKSGYELNFVNASVLKCECAFEYFNQHVKKLNLFLSLKPDSYIEF